MRLLAGIVTVGFVLAVTACGGDDNREETVATPTAEAQQAPEPTSSKADAAVSVTPAELARCLEKAGHKPRLIPAPPPGAPGAEYGSIGSVRVEVSRNNGVVAVFFKSAERAEELSKSGLTTLGASEVVGTVYLAANRGKPKELKVFRTCLKG